MNSNLRVFLTSAGIVMLPALLIPILMEGFVSLAAGSGEHLSLDQTGMVTCPEILTWTDWNEGMGELTLRDFMPHEFQGATPLAHRVGSNKKWLSVLTVYQVQFRTTEGEIREWAANGPIPLISQNTPRSWAVTALLALPSTLCFLAAWRWGREYRVNESDLTPPPAS